MTTPKPKIYNAAKLASSVPRVAKNTASEPMMPTTPQRLARLFSGLQINWVGTQPISGIAISSCAEVGTNGMIPQISTKQARWLPRMMTIAKRLQMRTRSA